MELTARTVSERPPRIPDFRLVECCGRGGFGTVYLGIDRDGVRRAVRVVRRDDSGPALAEYESAAVAAYRNLASGHPHLLEILYTGRTRSCVYYVLPLADRAAGANCRYRPLTLAEHLRRDDLYEAAKLRIVRDVASAAAFLHAHGAAHRDLKPENVLFVDGEVKVADPGMLAPARRIGVGGTPEFSPPRPTDGRNADVYALGVIIYCVFSGLPPERFPKLPDDWDTPFHAQLNRIVLGCCPPDGSPGMAASALVAALEGLEPPPRCGKLRHVGRRVRDSAALWVAAGTLLWGMFSCAEPGIAKTPPSGGDDRTVAAGVALRGGRAFGPNTVSGRSPDPCPSARSDPERSAATPDILRRSAGAR